MEKIKYIKPFSAVLLALTVVFFAIPVPAYAGGLDGAVQVKDNFLDGIEEAVKSTGLVDLKKQLWEEHKLLIKPYFKTRYDLTSNVFKAPDTDSDHTDSIFSFIPGFQWAWKNPYGVVGGAYEATFRYFTQFNNQNEQDQKFLVYANLNLTDNMYLRVKEQLDQQGATAGSSAFEPVDFIDNTIGVTLGYKLNDLWAAEFGYENFDRDFTDTIAKRYSYDEDKFDFRLYYQLTDAVRLWSGMRIGSVEFGKTSFRDTHYFEIPLGIEGTLPSGINMAASVGVNRRNRENASTHDLTHVVTNISLSKTFHEKTMVNFGFLRRPVESSFSTATTFDEKLWYGGVKHLVTPKLRARGDVYVGNRDFEDATILGTVVTAGGVAFIAFPETVKRDDDVFGVTVGFDYNVRKWLVMHMDYQYSRRNSNISALDYTENAFSLRSTVAL